MKVPEAETDHAIGGYHESKGKNWGTPHSFGENWAMFGGWG